MRLVLASLVLLAAIPVAAGDACVPSCEVASHQLAGFVPAVVTVASGSTVTWTELDGLHLAASRDFCFDATIAKGNPGMATFFVQDGVLYAASEGDPVEACRSATLTPDGTARLEYYCPMHPNMRSAFILVK